MVVSKLPPTARREGLLYLSMGHAAEAAGAKVHFDAGMSTQNLEWLVQDSLRFFRLAAQALQRRVYSFAQDCWSALEVRSETPDRHGKDPALEGTAVLELGLRLVKDCEIGNMESADLVGALADAGPIKFLVDSE